MRSTIKQDGTLELSLVEVPTPAPAADEVIVRVEASPLNPSDLGLLFGGADMTTAEASGTPENPMVTANVVPAVTLRSTLGCGGWSPKRSRRALLRHCGHGSNA